MKFEMLVNIKRSCESQFLRIVFEMKEIMRLEKNLTFTRSLLIICPVKYFDWITWLVCFNIA